MRCPKCQYISFDSGERCRNCGYDFSLTVDMPARDLPIQDGTEALGPFADLPLFKRPSGDNDAPLVAPGAAPRPPLAVRRATPAIPRTRQRLSESPDLLRESFDPEPFINRDTFGRKNNEPRLALEPGPRIASAPPAASAAQPEVSADLRPAGAGARILAAMIDVALIGGIDLAVLYLTLRLCDLRLIEAPTLPLAPFLGFLLLLNGGYFASFIAAGGQTIGKMAAGIRVISTRDRDDAVGVPFGHAALRAVAYIISALPAGLGFLPALFGRERRALHDRLAETRVVKA